MLKSIYFGNMGHSENIKRRIQKEVQKLESHLKGEIDPKFEVFVNNNNSKRSAGPPEYTCSMKLKFAKNNLFVSKTSDDFYHSIHQARKAMERLIQERTKRYIDDRSASVSASATMSASVSA